MYKCSKIDVSVRDWRRQLLKMAAESIAKSSESTVDREVKLLLQRQDWLDNLKKVHLTNLKVIIFNAFK